MPRIGKRADGDIRRAAGKALLPAGLYQTVLPGLAIVLVVLATNHLSQALQRAGGKDLR